MRKLTENVYKEIGARLRAFRSTENITAMELAIFLKTKKFNISKIENGKVGITTDNLISLAKKYGLNPLFLMTIEDKMYKEGLKE